MKSPSLTIDGTSDHVHILFSLARVITVADLIEEVKTESSKWIKTKGPGFRNLHCKKATALFPLASQTWRLRSAIFDPKFLNSYGIEYDERCVWD